MKICKFWTQESTTHTCKGEEFPIKCYGGSNVSMEDASRDALEKIALVKRRIEGDSKAFEEYESEIREEPLETLDDDSIVTRNRYGAKILNCRKLMFLDIDEPAFHFKDILSLIFGRISRKERILRQLSGLAANPRLKGLGIRVYETRKGYRVILLGRSFDPKSAETRSLMRLFNCDILYAHLCRKQGCFRARLTPKPYRMKLHGITVKYPRTLEEQTELDKWLAEYEPKSESYATCRFVAQYGDACRANDIVRYHDDATAASTSLKLA